MDPVIARELLSYGLKFGLVYATSSVILTQFDNLVVGLLHGTEALGFYDRAYRTSMWPTLLVSSALGRIALPLYSRLQDDPARMSAASGLVVWLVLTCATPIAMFILLGAPELVLVAYGAKWAPSVPILRILAAFAALRPLWDDATATQIAMGRAGHMARLVFVQAIVLILLAVPLTWLYGSVGTAFSVGLAFLISAAYQIYFVGYHLHVPLRETAGLPLFNNLAALALFLALRAVLPMEQMSPWLRLVAIGGEWASLYLLVSLVTSRRVIMRRVGYVLQAVRR
jgi:O-antigen/teichoic acid export membrane protein